MKIREYFPLIFFKKVVLVKKRSSRPIEINIASMSLKWRGYRKVNQVVNGSFVSFLFTEK
jgi:hypothetical protein